MADPVAILMAAERPAGETLAVPVLKVVDGDGFLTRITHPETGGQREASIRFGFIDAPEIGQPGGIEAREFLHSLIGGRWIEIAILTKMDTGGIVDRHGRIVCVPYLIDEFAADTNFAVLGAQDRVNRFWKTVPVARNIELEMVLNGWAWVLDRYGPDERYFEALEDARRHKRGIWASPDNLHPWEFKKQAYRARRAAPKTSQQPSLFDDSALCPELGCAGKLVERSGKFGAFLGCSNFPTCRYSCASVGVARRG